MSGYILLSLRSRISHLSSQNNIFQFDKWDPYQMGVRGAKPRAPTLPASRHQDHKADPHRGRQCEREWALKDKSKKASRIFLVFVSLFRWDFEVKYWFLQLCWRDHSRAAKNSPGIDVRKNFIAISSTPQTKTNCNSNIVLINIMKTIYGRLSLEHNFE